MIMLGCVRRRDETIISTEDSRINTTTINNILFFCDSERPKSQYEARSRLYNVPDTQIGKRYGYNDE